MAEPLTGPGGLARAVEAGEDPNADLNEVDVSATKAEAAVALRISGANYTNIAKVLGYSSAYRARMAVERALAATADSPEERDQQKVLADRRYSRLLQSVMGKAVDPTDPQHLAYNQRAAYLVERLAKLHGLDQQVLQVHVTQTDEAIKEYVKQMTALSTAVDQAQEAEIIDEGEILEQETSD